MEPTKYSAAIIGDGAVGKSCMTLRFLQDKFSEDYHPTIEELYRKNIMIDEEPFLLELRDTAGQEEFHSVMDRYLQNSDGFVVVYSITSFTSLQKATKLLQSIITTRSLGIPIVIAGNKSDLEQDRKIEPKQGEELADQYQAKFFECSAKTGTNVALCFEALVRRIKEYKSKPAVTDDPTPSQSKSCCIIL
ncbi:ras-like protein [Anaeramoeba ignava]|uniref:Ras-like protein n=1 Tax=Anaeramoeba ignava TaxID=1746090 RepID=A0A9Q0LIZ6_ANAIG|nr:ras-like protein [Anaeramoeba ignava]